MTHQKSFISKYRTSETKFDAISLAMLPLQSNNTEFLRKLDMPYYIRPMAYL